MRLFRLWDELDGLRETESGPKGLLDDMWFKADSKTAAPPQRIAGAATSLPLAQPLPPFTPLPTQWPILMPTAQRDPLAVWLEAKRREAAQGHMARVIESINHPQTEPAPLHRHRCRPMAD